RATAGSVVATVPIGRVVWPPAFGSDGVYVWAMDPATGRALFRTDGTPAGTTQVGALGALPWAGAVAVNAIGAGNRMFVAASDGTNGVEPWISDGTAAGTRPLADLNANGGSDPPFLGTAGARCFFIADDGVRGRELWQLDLAAVGAANAQSFGDGCSGAAGTPRLTADGIPHVGATGFGLLLERGRPQGLAIWAA